MDTLDNGKPVQYRPTELKRGFRNIIQAIEHGWQVYKLTPPQRRGYRWQIQWILYYLKQEKKSSTKDGSIGFFRFLEKPILSGINA